MNYLMLPIRSSVGTLATISPILIESVYHAQDLLLIDCIPELPAKSLVKELGTLNVEATTENDCTLSEWIKRWSASHAELNHV